MQSVKRINNCILFFIVFSLFSFSLYAQENSPYSRYGLGDLYPTQSISSRGMGGLTAAYSDGQSLNTNNPATYGDLRSFANGGLVTFDIGVSIDARTLLSNTPVSKYNSVNFIPSYILIGFPINKKHLGLAAGLKPLTRVNYSVASVSGDSLQNLFEGSGGLNQAFVGIGKRWGAFSIGVNGGYLFGRKETTTKSLFLNDSVEYHNGNIANTANYNGLFADVGVQFNVKLHEVKDSANKIKAVYGLTLGAAGMLKQNINTTSEVLNETFSYDANGGIIPIDTVSYRHNTPGKVVLPASFNAGIMFTKFDVTTLSYKWMAGAELSAGRWADYRFNGQPDQVVNNWMLRVGGQITPTAGSQNFLARTTYRLGLFTGKDYINADGNELKLAGATLGAGFHVRPARYTNQYTIINTAIEIGKRGSNVNNITENYFKFSVGLSLSDIWFIKRKYD